MILSVPGHPGCSLRLFVASSAGEWVDDPCRLPGESQDQLLILYLYMPATTLSHRITRRLAWSSEWGWRGLESRDGPPTYRLSLEACLRAYSASWRPEGLLEAVVLAVPEPSPEFLLSLLVMES